MGVFHVFTGVFVDFALSIDGSKRGWGYAPPEDLISVLRIELRLDSVTTLNKRRQQMTSFGSAQKNV